MGLLIKNARIVGRNDLKDIDIGGGRVIKVGKIRGRARMVVNAPRMLASPAFIDPSPAHIHLYNNVTCILEENP